LSGLLKGLQEAATETGTQIDIVLRSDSTLRGHFPLEPQLAESILGPFSAWVLAPAFFEGGRVTLDDVHYVQEGEKLVPAAETPFAADKGFGFKCSNLREWIAEKFEWKDVPRIESIRMDDLRGEDAPQKVATRLKEILSADSSGKPVIILNGFSPPDFQTFVAGVRLAGDPRLLYRTGASFVSAHLGIERIPPITPEKLFQHDSDKSIGGLIVVGSYVPKSTAQRNYLLERCKDHLSHYELDVEKLLSSRDQNAALIQQTIQDIEKTIESGTDVVLSTSRRLITSDDKKTSLEMGKIVSGVLNSIVKGITVRPRYVIAKASLTYGAQISLTQSNNDQGGITSSDTATEALGMKRAKVVGQAATGVPLWKSETVGTGKWVDVPYIVFPGNVGQEETLGDLVASYRVGQ
jgi:uncharacterized protein YgbK (DUF1537 family)